MRVRRCLLLSCVALGSAGTLLLAGPAAAAPRSCCIAPAPTYSVEPGTRKVTFTFSTPANYKPDWMNVGNSGTLRPDGSIKPTHGPDLRGKASPYTYEDWGPAPGWPTVQYFQIAYSCTLYPTEACPGGEQIVYGSPVKVDITAPAAPSKPKPVSADLAQVPPRNGTKACDTARARIVYLNGEIKKAVANLNFANKLGNSTTQKVRKQQLQKRLNDLQGQLPAAVAAGKKSC